MKKIFPILIFFFVLNSFAQKEANFWYFGENAGIDFNQTPPVAITDGQINTLEGCSSFSDADGNLLFYSDGIKVFDRNHDLMNYTNGVPADNLKGDPSSTQSGMIIPKPGSSTIYYLFTVDDGPEFNRSGSIIEDGNGFNYYTIDMSLNNGNGELIDENNDGIFFTDLSDGLFNLWEEKVAAVRGKECNTFWVISAVENFFYAYKVDETGVNLTPEITTTSNYSERRGYLKLSPDGTKLAIANQSSNSILYNFDNSNGKIDVSSAIFLTNGGFNEGEPYGVEFSPDSKKLYISTASEFRQNLNSSPVSYRLFQFDLNAENIPASKEIIHQQLAWSSDYPQGGFRGALQLGPDGKIYATIPLAYNDFDDTADPNGDAPFLDVIENPTEEASKVIFTKNAIDLKGRFATQGLPPFISSLLLPIEITDKDTNISINNQDLQFCEGQNKTIISEDLTGSKITYSWTFDDGSGFKEIANTKNLTLSNLQNSNSGKYALEIKLTDNCGNIIQYNGAFNVEVFENASTTKPVDIIFCDTDRDGFNDFDLRTDKNSEILNGLDPNVFDVLYFNNIEDVNSGDNPLPSPYRNPTKFSSERIYARVQNKNAPNACFAITDFTLAVTDLPIPTQPTPYRICDDSESGNDTDGIINTFLLHTKDNEIYGTLDKAQYNITYHTTQLGANTNDPLTVIDKNKNHSVTNYQTLFIRVENKDNMSCFDSNITLELFVDPLPNIKPNPELNQCIEVADTNTTVNLTLAENNISTTPNITFEYYEDIAGTNQIIDPTSYPVQVNIQQSVYVKVISEFNCSGNLTELKINVGQTIRNIYDETHSACDDFTGADGSDFDNITYFSLNKTKIQTEINPPINTKVFFYENENDRDNSLNEIDINGFRNDITKNNITNTTNGIQFPIYYRILSTINNDCQGLGQFYLQINNTPETSSQNLPPITECDTGAIDGNFSNGSNTNIDLTQRIDDAMNETGQDKNDFNFTFYKSATAALSGDVSNADYISDPEKFTNDVPNSFSQGDIITQTIFMRIENKSTGCVNPHTSFNVIINPAPIITNIISPLEVCDMGTKDGDLKNGLAQNIDISIRDENILGTRDATNFTITYHKTQADLEDLTSTGIRKEEYDSDRDRVVINTTTGNSEEILYIRIVNNTTGCIFDDATLTIIVHPEPNIPMSITNYTECDNISDEFNDDANGINGDITLNNKIPEILANYTPAEYSNFNITFYESSNDAKSGDTSLALNPNLYQNTSNDQPIYVRVENIATTCVYDDLSFLINIKPKPSFMVMGEENIDTPLTFCLNEGSLTLEAENPAADYNYIWTNETGDEIGSDFKQEITAAGKYTVTAYDKFPEGCSRVRTIVVKESNIATLKRSFIDIIDEGNIINSNNNLSISIDVINNDLGPGDYQFAIINTTNNNTRTPIIGFQEDSLFENLEGGIYTIIVNDKNGCVPDTTLEVSVIQFPKFFTPNADGQNDTYVIKGVSRDFYSDASINIFNRYGKLVAQETIDSQGWNGLYDGKLLPADDYWFNITLIPTDNTKPAINKKGHFSLIR